VARTFGKAALVRLCVAAAAAVCAAFWSAAAAQTPDDSAGFETWKQNFITTATARGIDAGVAHAALDPLTPDDAVIAIWNTRSGFSQPMWAYLDQTVSPARIQQARALMVAHHDVLQKLEAQYGVDPAIVVAIWGMETRFGASTLNYNALRSLATLSFVSDRSLYGNQLLALLRLIQAGRVSAAELRSSWDGGLGQAQLMPNTFETYAVDGDGDGRVDIWNDIDDALASIANVLQAGGWSHGEPTLIDARVPPGFELPPVRDRRPLAAWAAMGVTRANPNGPVDANLSDYGLLRPDPETSRTYFASQNFAVAARYNGSTRYGVAVALLARAAAGEMLEPWPRPTDALSNTDIAEMQRLLAALHYDVGDADGYYGEKTWRAMNAFESDHGDGSDAYPTTQVLAALRAQTASLSVVQSH
jgi:membrane-bound lytic murein transglycosylase B